MDAEPKYRPLAFPEYIVALFQRWTHLCTTQIPERCGLCGTPSKGSWLLGYYLPCIERMPHHHLDYLKIPDQYLDRPESAA